MAFVCIMSCPCGQMEHWKRSFAPMGAVDAWMLVECAALAERVEDGNDGHIVLLQERRGHAVAAFEGKYTPGRAPQRGALRLTAGGGRTCCGVDSSHKNVAVCRHLLTAARSWPRSDTDCWIVSVAELWRAIVYWCASRETPPGPSW